MPTDAVASAAGTAESSLELRAHPVLGALQGLLQDIYDAPNPHAVQEFLITDAAVAAALQGCVARATPERLLLRSDGEAVDLALYLEREVLDRLVDADPVSVLTAAHLPDFWTVLEGISHFVYVTWNAGFDRPVTLLELEMQAEVDKFVTARLLMLRQGAEDLPLHQLLFEIARLDAALEGDERQRYAQASALAGTYCQRLEDRYLARPDPVGLLSELRRFWRMPQQHKIRHIHAAG